VTQADYSNLGRLMVTVGLVGLLPLLVLPLLRREEEVEAEAAAPAPSVESTEPVVGSYRHD